MSVYSANVPSSRILRGLAKVLRFRQVVRLAPFETATEAGRAQERLRRAALTALASALARTVSLATVLISVPLTLHYLGAERYGMWMVISSFVAILGFLDLGVGNGVLTLTARLSGQDDLGGMRQVVSSAVAVLSGFALLFAGAFLLVYPRVDWFRIFNVSSELARSEAGPAIAVFAACFLASFPMSVAQKVQTGLQQGFTVGLWQACGSTLGLLAVLGVIHLEGGLPWLVAALFGVPQAAVAMNALYFFVFRRPDLRPSLRWARRSVMVKVLSTGLLFLVLQLVVAVTYSSDSVIIAQMQGPAAVASYAVPEKMFAVVSSVLALLTMPLWPAFGEALTRGDRDWVARMLTRSIMINVVLAGVASSVLVVAGPWLISAWVGQAFNPSLLLLAGFAVWKVCEAGGTPIAMLLNGAHVVAPQIMFATLTALVAVGMKLLLIGHIGVAGAIWATSIAYLPCSCIPSWMIARRSLRQDKA
ncbi:lipopolysaccharide biosynthesis protein [Prosthecomicrobium hirschii]|uniref:lipopolysaccharide biosynthesis protein n=1 Tax=Prosthecodimorpha hirschii TaxID=665126 RepID=UPI00221E7889|nr:oligosaccharide flippase family protein [Prosthecomicrobium hirschii]MCW1843779.1 oligosaccharide flippase family protein [Prosthecomicrobium hirschii]